MGLLLGKEASVHILWLETNCIPLSFFLSFGIFWLIHYPYFWCWCPTKYLAENAHMRSKSALDSRICKSNPVRSLLLTSNLNYRKKIYFYRITSFFNILFRGSHDYGKQWVIKSFIESFLGKQREKCSIDRVWCHEGLAPVLFHYILSFKDYTYQCHRTLYSCTSGRLSQLVPFWQCPLHNQQE